ncbi:MAG: c-type cytochrome [Candidatus Thiodiazotropha sp. (ex Codakia rugifera)]|nr:c-type cytochrome [Candidatus Thiodiazotropha sp. (ex Codakia rugifera)]
MNSASVNILGVAVITLLVGAAVLLTMVRYELGPKSRLARGGQWLLATALGTGILAFALKLVIMLAIVNFPETLVEPLIRKAIVERPVAVADPLYGMTSPQRFVWQPLPMVTESISTGSHATTNNSTYVWEALPEQAPSPKNNPVTPEKVALGERLFFDKKLSRDGTLSCSTCHDVIGGSGDDGRARSIGIDGQQGGRNAPTVWNTAFQSVLFWDGRAVSLEEQAKGPLVNPTEMGMVSLTAVEERIRKDTTYQQAFAQAFGVEQPITIQRIVEAIAAYERTLITPDTPYDRFVRGDLDALSPEQLQGMALFQSLGCVSCHFGPNFSGASLFDPRAPMRIFPIYPTPYEQQYELTHDSGAAGGGGGRGSWRVPSLRNVALTGPWFHNGSVTDLAEAVRVMSSVQLGRTGRYLVWADTNKVFTQLDRPELDEHEVNDIVAFLHALSSDKLVQRIQLSKAQAGVAFANN